MLREALLHRRELKVAPPFSTRRSLAVGRWWVQTFPSFPSPNSKCKHDPRGGGGGGHGCSRNRGVHLYAIISRHITTSREAILCSGYRYVYFVKEDAKSRNNSKRIIKWTKELSYFQFSKPLRCSCTFSGIWGPIYLGFRWTGKYSVALSAYSTNCDTHSIIYDI